METETVAFNAKGQVVIPAALRRKFGIRDSTKALVSVTTAGILLRPITRDYIHSLRGSLKGKGILKALTNERRRQRSPFQASRGRSGNAE
jgi:AbrB family looped-hinge helix DNA binding protein